MEEMPVGNTVFSSMQQDRRFGVTIVCGSSVEGFTV